MCSICSLFRKRVISAYSAEVKIKVIIQLLFHFIPTKNMTRRSHDQHQESKRTSITMPRCTLLARVHVEQHHIIPVTATTSRRLKEREKRNYY